MPSKGSRGTQEQAVSGGLRRPVCSEGTIEMSGNAQLGRGDVALTGLGDVHP